MEGEVDDAGVETVWLVANDRRIPAVAHAGRFRAVLPVSVPVLRVWAEASRNGAPPGRSGTVTVRGPETAEPATVLVLDWPAGTEGLDVEVTGTWRERPETLEDRPRPVRFAAVARRSGTGPADVFYLSNVKPGVYTVVLRYRGAPGGRMRPTLYLPAAEGLRPHVLTPTPLAREGTVVLARFLLPFGVFWDQEAWFSGTSESVDTVTKFRLPEGVVWVERKGEPG
ncbi:MAG TPA: hypothetical protein VNO23_17500 [Candidatus Binatia bacterium]|nr:hypothetical protein [Candidatus Binatia bacterium]